MSLRRPRSSGDDTVAKQLRPAAKISRGLAAVLQKQGIPVLEVIRRFVGSSTAFSMDHLNDIITDLRREANEKRAGVSQPPHGAWDDLAIVLTGERLPKEYRQAHDSNASTFLRNLRGCSAAYNMLGIYMFQLPELDYDAVCSLSCFPALPDCLSHRCVSRIPLLPRHCFSTTVSFPAFLHSCNVVHLHIVPPPPSATPLFLLFLSRLASTVSFVPAFSAFLSCLIA
jgi:hypothetical protein